jgi:predicted transcriptional regulator
MSRNEHTRSRWSRCIGALVHATIGKLTSVAHRVKTPSFWGVPVSAAILTRVVTVRPEQPLDEVAQILVCGRQQLLPVLEHGWPVAVLTREDVAAGLERSGPHATVAAAPSHHVVTVTPTDSLAHVLGRLQETPDAVVVVVDRAGPVGLLTADSVRAYLDQAVRYQV